MFPLLRKNSSSVKKDWSSICWILWSGMREMLSLDWLRAVRLPRMVFLLAEREGFDFLRLDSGSGGVCVWGYGVRFGDYYGL